MLKTKSLDEARRIIENSPRVVVFFHHEHCASCPSVEAALEKAEQEAEGWTFLDFNVINVPGASGAFNIMSVPTVLIFTGGQVQATWREKMGPLGFILKYIKENGGAG